MRLEPVVMLGPDEIAQAVAVASRRRISCMFDRKKEQHYDAKSGDEWSTEIESCCAEIVVSKYLNRYWSGGVFYGARAEFDVDGKQVRHTIYATGKLIIYPEDNPDSKFVLVTGKAPKYIIRGWFYARDAIDKGEDHEWWRLPEDKLSPSWWVPQASLYDMPSRKT